MLLWNGWTEEMCGAAARLHAAAAWWQGRRVAVWWMLIGLAWWLLGAGAPLHAQPRRSVSESGAAAREVVLDLSKKEVFVRLSVNADPEEVVVSDVQVDNLPTEHRLVPDSGMVRLGRSLDIRLQEPDNVRIRLSVVRRGDGVGLRVSPQIVLGTKRAIELTQDRIKRAARNLSRHAKHLSQQLGALVRQRRALNHWLIAPGNKPLETVEAVQMRLKILGSTIKRKKQHIPIVQRQCVMVGQAAKFVDKLHDTVKIRYAVETDDAAKRR